MREYKRIFNLEEISKYHLDKINNSFFNKGINCEIDNLQENINNNYNLLNLHATKLSHLLEENSTFVRLEHNERDGHYLSITSKRLELLKKKFKYTKNSNIKLTNTDIKISPNDLEFKSINKTSSRITSSFIRKLSSTIRNQQFEIGDLCRGLYINQLEQFDELYMDSLKQITNFIAQIDTYKSVAKASVMYGYTKPKISIDSGMKSSFIDAKDIRHPIIERIQEEIEYVPNDILIGKDLKGMLLYGTNASGKSSLMKAVGLNIIMAQAGFYVASSDFTYYPYHYLFTRINNNDNIFKGESSFAVEMMELRNILKRGNNSSLILGDELCSGTESISALSIFAASVKYLSKIDSSFIFATHLHELTKMDALNGLNNVEMFHLKVEYDEDTGDLIYNRKIEKGSGDAIYGLEVCKAMDMDSAFLKDANEIRQNIMGVKEQFNSGKVSQYNSSLFIENCAVCNKPAEDTHHIKFQCTANKDGMIGHIQKDTKSNLVPLCKECHNSVHNNTIIINGYKQTSIGIILDYQKVSNESRKKNRKYNNEQLEIIQNCIDTYINLNLKVLSNKIEQEHDIKISSTTLNKIKKGVYAK
jgi:DNA mismatch repair protein MutS